MKQFKEFLTEGISEFSKFPENIQSTLTKMGYTGAESGVIYAEKRAGYAVIESDVAVFDSKMLKELVKNSKFKKIDTPIGGGIRILFAK